MTESVNVVDPVFISYRQSDGAGIAAELAWLLRAAGIPVWRDKDDLPPGDTNERLDQAINDGLSGGLLLITPEVSESKVVKFVEAPRLIKLHQACPEFALAIVNAIRDESGDLDYAAPDELLGMKPGTLSGVDQKSGDREGFEELVKGILSHRITRHRNLVAAADSTFSLSVQTRNTGQVYDRTGGQLDIRVRPSAHERLPDADGLRDLAQTIGLLPQAVTRSGAQRVRITGGAHLSVAFAIGASLPSTRVGQLEVIDQRNSTWASGGEATIPDPPNLQVVSSGAGTPTAVARPEVAVYLDLTGDPSDAAFSRFLDEYGGGLTAWQQIVLAQPGLVDPQQAASITAEASARIRSLSNAHSNARVHLLLRCPFAIAVLVGRLTNTMRITTHEWDDSDPVEGDDHRPRFVPVMEVRTSAPNGVITGVLL